MYFFLVALHLAGCLVFFYLRKTDRLMSRNQIPAIVCCIPIWGPLLAVLDESVVRRGMEGSKEFGLERLEPADKRFQVMEVDPAVGDKRMVPLEEAMLINDAKTRRALMLDILHKKPEEYVDLLKRARMSDDVELTHYATTTIMEVQSEYEAQIQRCEAEARRQPNNERVLRNYARAVGAYINSGLISGNVLQIQRMEQRRILERLLRLSPDDRRRTLAYLENELELGENEDILRLLEEARQKWRQDERVYMLLVRYYRQRGEGKRIQLLLKQMKEEGIYLSKEGREWYSFWKTEDVNA